MDERGDDSRPNDSRPNDSRPNDGESNDGESNDSGPRERNRINLGDYRLSEIVRRVRRTAGLSQRELATYAGVGASTVGDVESEAAIPSIPVLQRILNAAGYQLVVADSGGHLAVPLLVWQGVTDGAGRRYPAHLDTIIDPVFGEWWADCYGLARPPETFHRNSEDREYRRRLSQWEVRVAQHRHEPPPQRRVPGRPA